MPYRSDGPMEPRGPIGSAPGAPGPGQTPEQAGGGNPLPFNPGGKLKPLSSGVIPAPPGQGAPRRAPQGPALPPELPAPPSGGGGKQLAESLAPPPAPAFQRPADAASAFMRQANLGAFDPRLRSRIDVQEAMDRSGFADGPALSNPGMTTFGIAPGFNPKQFEEENRLMGILKVLGG